MLDRLDLQIEVTPLTSADLTGEEHVGALRLAEALQYRAYEARNSGPG